MSHRLFLFRTHLEFIVDIRRRALHMSPSQNGIKNGITPVKPQNRSNIIPFSSRLKEGRALAQDVWSIYKYVPFIGLEN